MRTYSKKRNISLTPIITNFIPTFHILIATGGRSSLKNMLYSLKDELTENDAITIVFDGPQALENSSFELSWIENHRSKIKIIEQDPNLGFWGHGVRNTYQSILEPNTTFIMHADDDDIYNPGSFNKLRKICTDPDILYIAKFLIVNKNILVPSQNTEIRKDDIGTPCGIIPFKIANKGVWQPRYGGDFDYYNNIKQFVKEIKFLDTIIYSVL